MNVPQNAAWGKMAYAANGTDGQTSYDIAEYIRLSMERVMENDFVSRKTHRQLNKQEF